MPPASRARALSFKAVEFRAFFRYPRRFPRTVETMADELDLNTLDDAELVEQMHDDLYDGLKEEIEEGVRILLKRNWTPEKRAAHMQKPFKERGWDAEFSKLMGRDGWIGVSWPKQFGGQARTPSEQIVFVTELANAVVPYHAHNTSESIVAPSLFAYGSKEQQDEWIPKIRNGECRIG